MKKCLILLIGIVSIFGISTVKADTFQASSFYDRFDESVEILDTYSDNISQLISMWETNHTSEYPYYVITYGYDIDKNISIYLISLKSVNAVLSTSYIQMIDYDYDSATAFNYYSYKYYSKTNSYSDKINVVPIFYRINYGYYLLKSNFVPVFYEGNGSYSQDGQVIKYDFDKISVSSYTSTKYNITFDPFEINLNSYLPTIETLRGGSYSPSDNNYVEINLNNYAYVALSLKDYTKEISNSYSEYSNVYVKGQLCATPIYNYGQTEKKDIITGSKTQACSQYYNDYELTRFYILPSDVKNHAIYYLKAYDTSKENLVKVNSKYFDISYITEEDKNNPQVSINGKVYPTLSYDQLTDTSTKSEDEGYISGVSCAVGDFNCYEEYNESNVFKDIFDKPLEALKSVWSAIINVFEIIKWFILLLPPTLQSFLYLSFMIAIILGIIKIVL